MAIPLQPTAMPIDGNAKPFPLTPAKQALSGTVNASISSSATLDVTLGASILRVYPADKDAFLKWGTTAVTTGNFDEILPANQVVDLVIPVDPTTGLRFTTTRVIERSATSTLIVSQK